MYFAEQLPGELQLEFYTHLVTHIFIYSFTQQTFAGHLLRFKDCTKISKMFTFKVLSLERRQVCKLLTTEHEISYNGIEC